MMQWLVAYVAAWLLVIAYLVTVAVAYGWAGLALAYVGLSLVTCLSQVGQIMFPFDWVMFALLSPLYFTTLVSDYFDRKHPKAA